MMRPAFNGCGCILNQPKWSINSEVISAAVTVKGTPHETEIYVRLQRAM
jgi:hypothetical protein